MIKISFKNLEKSQLAEDIVYDRFSTLVEKFPDLEQHRIDIFLSMDNSFTKRGRDFFAVKIVIRGRKYGGVVIEKENTSLYSAIDDLLSVMVENLNRKGDKTRVKNRTIQRKHKQVS